jgi:hypothetical protein
MSASIGPDIVNDGLILSLDASNIKSFRGEPTTNLLGPQCEDIAGSGWTKEGGFGTYTNNYEYAPDGTKTATRLVYSSGYFYRQQGTSPAITGLTAGVIITFSCWVKSLDGNTQSGKGIGIWSYAKSGIDAVSEQTISATEWTRCSVTYTIHSTPTPTTFCFMLAGAPSNIFQGDIAVWHPQLEFKDHVTHFTASTRGTTVSTGGGLEDLSGNGNHGELLGPIYDSSNLGILEFNGSSDYVRVPYSSILAPTDVVTVSCWAYKLDWSTSSNERLISKTEMGGYTLGYNIDFSSGIFYIRRNNYYGTITINWSNVTSGWHLFTGVYDGRYMRAYIDGESVGTNDAGSTYPIQYAVANDLMIGAEAAGGTTPAGQWFVGKIANAQVYNSVLGQTEVTKNFNALKGRFGL